MKNDKTCGFTTTSTCGIWVWVKKLQAQSTSIQSKVRPRNQRTSVKSLGKVEEKRWEKLTKVGCNTVALKVDWDGWGEMQSTKMVLIIRQRPWVK